MSPSWKPNVNSNATVFPHIWPCKSSSVVYTLHFVSLKYRPRCFCMRTHTQMHACTFAMQSVKSARNAQAQDTLSRSCAKLIFVQGTGESVSDKKCSDNGTSTSAEPEDAKLDTALNTANLPCYVLGPPRSPQSPKPQFKPDLTALTK